MRKLLILICCAALVMGQKPVNPTPSTPDPSEFPIPDIPFPPDSEEMPFDPPDIPEPFDVPFPHDDPWDPPFPPEDFPVPEPPPFPDDPFDDTPSLYPDAFDDLPILPLPDFPGSEDVRGRNSRETATATPVVLRIATSTPVRLPFFPYVIPFKGQGGTKPACDPVYDTRMFFPDPGRNRVIVFGSCPKRFITSITAGSGAIAVRGTPDAKALWVGNYNDGTVSVIDTTAYKLTRTITLPLVDGVAPHPGSIAFTMDGAKAYITNHVGSGNGPGLFVMDVASGKMKTFLRTGTFPTTVRTTPDGAQVWLTSTYDNSVYVIDTLSDTQAARIQVQSADGLTFLPDGTAAYIGSSDSPGNVVVIDMSTYKQIASIPLGNFPAKVLAAPSGRQVFVAHYGSPFLSLIDSNTNKEYRRIQLKHPTRTIGFIR